MLVLKKPMDLNFEPLRSLVFNGHDPVKVKIFKYRHDGTLSIRNFALNQAQLLISHTSVVHEISYLFFYSFVQGVKSVHQRTQSQN
jgi:hypothetical protein